MQKPDVTSDELFRYHNTNIMNVACVISGFLLTGILVLLTGSNGSAPLETQMILFFLSFLFGLFILIIADHLVISIELIFAELTITPYMMKRNRLVNSRLILLFILFGVSTPIMFLAWGLLLLGILSFVSWLNTVICGYVVSIKPFLEASRKRHAELNVSGRV